MEWKTWWQRAASSSGAWHIRHWGGGTIAGWCRADASLKPGSGLENATRYGSSSSNGSVKDSCVKEEKFYWLLYCQQMWLKYWMLDRFFYYTFMALPTISLRLSSDWSSIFSSSGSLAYACVYLCECVLVSHKVLTRVSLHAHMAVFRKQHDRPFDLIVWQKKRRTLKVDFEMHCCWNTWTQPVW